MKIKRAWAIQSFIVCFLVNAALGALVFFMADRIALGLTDWISPFLKPGSPGIPDEARTVLGGLGTFLAELRTYLAPAISALIGACTLLLWFFVFLVGRRQINRAAAAACTPPKPVTVRNAQEGEPSVSERQAENSAGN